MTEEEEKFANECDTLLKNHHKQGIEIYAPFLTQMMRQCQTEFQDESYSTLPSKWETKWKYLLLAAKGFDPRIRCFTQDEFTHFPHLLILKSLGKKDEFAYYMLRYRIAESRGSEKEKDMLIHAIERKKHELHDPAKYEQ